MRERGGIEALLDLIDEAFRGPGIEEGHESQALITDVTTVPDDAWRALPKGVTRTIESMVLHVGACKIMYDDYAFGSGSLQWGTPEVDPFANREGEREDVMAWLENTHARLVGHIAALTDDAELDRPRPTNWGELRPTRWIVAAMITHDAYHSGEINHLRSLLGTDDRWRYIQEGFG